MGSILIPVGVGVAALAIGLWLGPRIRGWMRPNAPLGKELAELSKSVEKELAHPRDLLLDDAFERGVARLSQPDVDRAALIEYATGASLPIACMALVVLARKPRDTTLFRRLLRAVGTTGWFRHHYLMPAIAAHTPEGRSPVAELLVTTSNDRWVDWWEEEPAIYEDLERFVRERIHGGEVVTLSNETPALSSEGGQRMEALLDRLDLESLAGLRKACADRATGTLDLEFLRSVGKLRQEAVPDADSDALLQRHRGLDEAVERAYGLLTAGKRRSVLLVGAHGVGKSVAGRAVFARLRSEGWTIFEAGATEVVAGQIYVGQIEQRVQLLLAQLRPDRKVLWFVPELAPLLWAGRHSEKPVGVLDLILPAIERGELLVVGEATESALEKLIQQQPRVRNAFASVRLDPLERAESVALARSWAGAVSRAQKEPLIDDATIDEAWQLTQQYLTDRAAPGNLIGFLGATWQRLAGADGRPARIGADDLIVTLAGQTGLPSTVLDDRAGLDLAELRRTFDRRVKGQPEAVDCLVDRVAMIKAGLTDPTRPAGVFLFAGPTGTGKTEIVKALTQFLFGSEQRMIRIDMSELQSEDALARLVGAPVAEAGETQSLAEQIRKQPFSVILLDEFEKAHPKVWDLFLQVFDDGRLTDRRGKLADFRHAIIVLTSNLGARLPAGAGLGFVDDSGTFRPGVVLKTIEQSFRKEFINRLDRIVVFRPLSRETMREILGKELDSAYRRRGLRNRGWAVEWEDAAFEFLLDRGFTPDLGARPLRRAIERYLLSPLARTIVDHRYPEGDQFLFVKLRDGGLEVEFIDPDAPEERPAPPPPELSGRSIARLVLSPEGSPAELEQLGAELERLEQAVAADAWRASKASDAGAMSSPGFWNDPARFVVLGRVEYQDRIEAGVGRSRSLYDRLVRSGAGARERHPRDPIRRLAQQLYLIGHAVEDVGEKQPTEAFLQIDSGPAVGEQHPARVAFARRLDRMYRDWCSRRGMQCELLDDSGSSDRHSVTLAISGYAAHTLLTNEDGMHVLELPAAGGHSLHKLQVRVAVAPQPATPPADGEGLRRQAGQAFDTRPFDELAVVRHYREQPAPLVRDASGWRSGLLDRVLAGDFDLIAAAAGRESPSRR